MGTSAAPVRLRAGVPHAMPCSTVLPTSTRVRVGLCALGALALSAHGAFAAEGAKTGPSEVIFLVQLVALMLVGRLLGELMNRIGQPSVMGMLLGGIVLGPSVREWCGPMCSTPFFRTRPSRRLCSMASRSSAFSCCCC
jgi:hypothetical protein